MSRTTWRRWTRRVLLAGFLIAVACVAWGFGIEPGRLVQRDYSLQLPHWPAQCDGVRIDVVSDIHTGSPHNGVDNLDRVVATLASSDSSAVLMAGDYLIHQVFLGTYVPPEVVAEHLRPLTARKPVYAVWGNHDWWKDGAKVRMALESAGIVVLENEAREVRLGQCHTWLVGIGDLWEGHPDIPRAFAPVAEQQPVLALTHNPDVFPHVPAQASLVIAGHTHGGQVNLPLLGRLVVPSKLGDRYAVGSVIEGGRHLFVTPGIGTSILPVRFGVPPEISRLTLRAAGSPITASSKEIP